MRLYKRASAFWFNPRPLERETDGTSGVRHEFKYILTNSQARSIASFLERAGGLRRDRASAYGGYLVTSLYFDTPTLEDYYDKLAGSKFRHKLRARIYHEGFESEAHAVWLEIKEKHDMTIRKRRSQLPFLVWEKFLERDMTAVLKEPSVRESPLLKEFFYLYLLQGYRPTVVVQYRRAAFTASFMSGVRVTFDSDMRTCEWRNFVYTNPVMTPVQDGSVVMEIKFNAAMPWWFAEMVRRFRLSRQAFSKYVTATDALNRLNPLPR